MTNDVTLGRATGNEESNKKTKRYSLRFLHLEDINPLLHKQAKDAARCGDFDGIIGCADSNMSLYLLSKNSFWCSYNDLFEKALLAAWVNQKCVPHDFYPKMKEGLLSCSREKLMKYSDVLPEGDTFTVYRGVDKGMPRGISWSLDLKIARHFASMFGKAGKVYKTTVTREDIYAYIHENGRNEKEVLLILADSHPIELLKEIPQTIDDTPVDEDKIVRTVEGLKVCDVKELVQPVP